MASSATNYTCHNGNDTMWPAKEREGGGGGEERGARVERVQGRGEGGGERGKRGGGEKEGGKRGDKEGGGRRYGVKGGSGLEHVGRGGRTQRPYSFICCTGHLKVDTICGVQLEK